MARITITGNLTREPELKYTQAGKAVVRLSIAENYKANRDAEDQVTFYEVTLWDSLAENVANSLTKGDRVIVEGRLKQDNWETEDGQKKSKLTVQGDSCGPDLRFHTAVVTKREKHQKFEDDEDKF